MLLDQLQSVFEGAWKIEVVAAACLNFGMTAYSVTLSSICILVTALVLYKMLDVTKLEADTMVTVFQFHSYFAEIGGSSSIAEHLDRLEAQRE